MSTGQGLGFGAMTAATLEGLPLHQRGVAGAVNVTAQQIGNSVGLAILVAVSTGVSGGATNPADQLSGFHAAYWVAGAIGLLGGLTRTAHQVSQGGHRAISLRGEAVTAPAGHT
ncbi:hypothetical protein [Streptomyces sp. NEAU-S7GS2]|uniref:hypothetical protein n=1 Tax=Streptomyces sp. NEAU-S7GS2 TaxID=2202000 RepID=UPI001EF66A6A|nr:hypothetical protein [Streptomyces sp. NEAU-S7GS2]